MRIIPAKRRPSPPLPVIAPPYVFVSVPYARKGVWLRCSLAILKPCPRCQAEPLEPCRFQRGWTSGTHHRRRNKPGEPYRIPRSIVHRVKFAAEIFVEVET